mmetsp:Transcript_80510/g.231121  ORF Transcript_80510/g.231121 Transcript_80510/m.231121 type:complete len:231 (-) Transcript_80510:512-1204(-)
MVSWCTSVAASSPPPRPPWRNGCRRSCGGGSRGRRRCLAASPSRPGPWARAPRSGARALTWLVLRASARRGCCRSRPEARARWRELRHRRAAQQQPPLGGLPAPPSWHSPRRRPRGGGPTRTSRRRPQGSCTRRPVRRPATPPGATARGSSAARACWRSCARARPHCRLPQWRSTLYLSLVLLLLLRLRPRGHPPERWLAAPFPASSGLQSEERPRTSVTRCSFRSGRCG